MKPRPDRKGADPFARRDILAICAYLNRGGPRAVDACSSESQLDRIAAAARMQ